MTRTSELRLAQVFIAVLLLVIIRSLGEVFRLQYLHGDALVIGQVIPYVIGALFAAVGLALTLICYFVSRYRTSTAIAATTLILLFLYKVVVVSCALDAAVRSALYACCDPVDDPVG
jgi:hypothetical protein